MSKNQRLILPLLFGIMFAFLIAFDITVSEAQGDRCAAIFAESLATTSATCAALPSGSLCAGTGPVEVIDASGMPIIPSPMLSLDGLTRITTSALDPVGEQWSVAMMRLPGLGSDEQITAVLYGDATLTDSPRPPVAPVCNAVSIGEVNVRTEPSTNAAILGQLNFDETAPITARLTDSSWWQIVWDGEPAWVFAQLTPADCDPAAMLVLDPATGTTSGGRPAPSFQSAHLETSFDTSVCPDIPRSGLLLQAEGESATWQVNNVTLGFNGTLLLQVGRNDVLAVHVLEGQTVLEVAGVSRTAGSGKLLRVPLQDGVLESLPGLPIDVITADVAHAPITLLPRPVTPMVANTTVMPLPDDADLTCDVVPHSFTVTPTNQIARVSVAATVDQSVRMSAEVDSDLEISRLTAQAPDGREIATGERIINIVTQEAGIFVFEAEIPTNVSVRFNVTCDLPIATAPPQLQSCDSTFMRWEEVSGNAVRFLATSGAQISVIAEHALPSQGAAGTLEVLNGAGERIGNTAFVPFQDRVTAGPLDVVLLQDGEYVIRWDGDPFNIMEVETLCLPPTDVVTPPDETSS